MFGSENITIPTITRPWIVPNEVIVRETDDSAYIYKATLKVMLEEDYLTSRGGSRTAPTPDQYSFSDPRLKELNQYSTQLIKDTIIPKLTQEVNSSQRYAKLRQVYYSLVLSRWFKMKYQGKPGQYPELIDRQNLTNLVSKQAWDKQTYFSQYQESFAKGEYSLKETVASPFGQSIRSYVSGGIVVGSPIAEGGVKVSSPAVVTDNLVGDGDIFDRELKVIKSQEQPLSIAASPLTVDDVVEVIKKAREELIRFYPDNDAGLSVVSIDELIVAATKAGDSKQKINALELSDETEKWYELTEELVRLKAYMGKNMSKYKEELVSFFSQIREYPYIKLKEDDYAYYSSSYTLEIKETQDVNVIIKAAEHANWLRDIFLREET